MGSYTVSLLSNHKKHMLMVTSLLLAGASTLCAALIPRLPALLSFLLLQGFGLGEPGGIYLPYEGGTRAKGM